MRLEIGEPFNWFALFFGHSGLTGVAIKREPLGLQVVFLGRYWATAHYRLKPPQEDSDAG